MSNWDKFKPADSSLIEFAKEGGPTASVIDNVTAINGAWLDAAKTLSWPIMPAPMKAEHDAIVSEYTGLYGSEPNPVSVGIDMAQPGSDQTVIATYHYITDEKPTIYNHVNLFVDAKSKTHTPEGGRKLTDKVILYYSCTDCPATLDPNTTRFAELNNHAMRDGWKIRWGHNGYDPFCPTCAEKRGIND